MNHLLAYTPFLDPLDLHDAWWITILPLALGISLAYKAIRVPTLDRLPREVVLMTVQTVGAMVLLSLAVYVMVELLIPLLW
ncbi:MAG: hypothetical protein SFZ24_12740 [Planctomycetota bacterium]|nr:hypothetical protein [Planctomycetota bacterium]